MPGYFSIPDVYPKYTIGMLTPKTVATPTVAGGKVQPKAGVRSVGGTITPGTGTGDFNINPPPTTGQGPYGMVPGTIAYPNTPYVEGTRIYAGLPKLTESAARAIQAQIEGEFDTAPIWDAANTYGVTSGMSRDQITNLFYKNQIDKLLAERQKGITNYNTFA